MNFIGILLGCIAGLWMSTMLGHAAPLSQNDISNRVTPDTNVTVDSIDWLQRFGYFVRPDPRSGALMSEESLADSIRELQRFAGLPETGVMDEKTRALIKETRCGVPDFGPMDKTKKRRKRRFTLQGTFWQKRDLTWRLTNTNDDGLSTSLVESILERAFAKWAAVTKLRFSKVASGEADIMVNFNRGYHRDSYPFDGRGGTLAHAFYPHDNKGLSGDVHFDDDEQFTHEKDEGKNLLWVAVHEIGHSIGLQHSNVKAAIMYPWYQGYKGKDFDLTVDDITGIQHIYGAPPQTTAAPTSIGTEVQSTLGTQPPAICIRTIGAIFLGNDKRTYVINNDKLYILRKDTLGVEKGPILVNSYFKGVSTVDAAYTRFDHRTVLFSGKYFYVFDDDTPVEGPRLISDHYQGFPAAIEKIDAAFVWPGNGRTYLFSGKLYWRYDRVSQKVDYGYPRKISHGWHGIPSTVDAVFAWRNGATYFFKGSNYYRLRKTTPVNVEYGYPKSVLENWIKCKENQISAGRGAGGRIVASFPLAFISVVLGLLRAVL